MYLIAGVNDLTIKSSNQIRIDTQYVSRLPFNYLSECQMLNYSAEIIAPQSKIIICPMLGVSIVKYNCHLQGLNYPGRIYGYSAAQLDLDFRLKRLNNEIFVFNRSCNLNTPTFHERLFNNYRGRGIRCSYGVLHDGLHPTNDMCVTMINKIIDCDMNPFFIQA